MADARALLKAKRQEARVNHPLASYNSTGQLRCVACGTIVKHASSWEGHVGSKAHRVNAARLREAQQKRAEQEELTQNGKRKAEGGEDEAMEEDEAAVKKRKLSTPDDQDVSVRPPPSAAASAFPADFFSDPSKAPSLSRSDDEDDEEPVVQPQATTDNPSAIDAEWAQFQQTVLDAPDEKETYERATAFAEPVLVDEVPEGFPPRDGADGSPNVEDVPPTEEEIRRKKEQDERELIMDRLMEEERAQEEADAKVSMLKQKLENLRRQRAATKQAKHIQSTKS